MSGMSATGDPSVHVSLIVDQGGARIVVNGVDLSTHCRGFRVEAGVGACADVWLDLIGVTLDIQAEVPRSRIQALTPEQDELREHAHLQRDIERGARTYGGTVPAVTLAVSLGDRTP